MNQPPDYLKGIVVSPSKDGPANLLLDGHWCGHGEPLFNVFAVQADGEKVFTIQLPVTDDEELNSPLVMATSDKGAFVVYDATKHPASGFYALYQSLSGVPKLQPVFQCPNCQGKKFLIAVGFEIPEDSDSPLGTSWFALAAQCVNCGWEEIVYDDETA